VGVCAQVQFPQGPPVLQTQAPPWPWRTGGLPESMTCTKTLRLTPSAALPCPASAVFVDFAGRLDAATPLVSLDRLEAVEAGQFDRGRHASARSPWVS